MNGVQKLWTSVLILEVHVSRQFHWVCVRIHFGIALKCCSTTERPFIWCCSQFLMNMFEAAPRIPRRSQHPAFYFEHLPRARYCLACPAATGSAPSRSGAPNCSRAVNHWTSNHDPPHPGSPIGHDLLIYFLSQPDLLEVPSRPLVTMSASPARFSACSSSFFSFFQFILFYIKKKYQLSPSSFSASLYTNFSESDL